MSRSVITVALVTILLAAGLGTPAMADDVPGGPAAAGEDAPPPSPGVMAEARRRFTRGNLLYRQGNYKEALLVYQAALDLYHRPGILYNMAQTYEKLRDPANAALYFQRYLALRPDAADHAAVTRRIEQLRQQAIMDVAITSYPPGAAIFVGSRESGVKGRTPFTLRLPLGKQTVFIELDGFVPERREITVDLGQRNFLDAQLRRRSSIRVDADIPGARAILTGWKAPVRLPHVFEVDPGSYPVRVELDGYHTVERVVELQAGEQISFLVNLKALPKYGQLQVEGRPGAHVRLEDKQFDVLPMPPRKVEAGSYRVTVTREGYRPWEGKVTVNAGNRTVARVTLTPYRSKLEDAALYGSSGLAAVSLITGTVFGALALRTERENNTSASLSKAEAGRVQALTADVLFAVAGASAIGAVVTFLVTRRGPSTSDLSFTAEPPEKKAAK